MAGRCPREKRRPPPKREQRRQRAGKTGAGAETRTAGGPATRRQERAGLWQRNKMLLRGGESEEKRGRAGDGGGGTWAPPARRQSSGSRRTVGALATHSPSPPPMQHQHTSSPRGAATGTGRVAAPPPAVTAVSGRQPRPKHLPPAPPPRYGVPNPRRSPHRRHPAAVSPPSIPNGTTGAPSRAATRNGLSSRPPASGRQIRPAPPRQATDRVRAGSGGRPRGGHARHRERAQGGRGGGHAESLSHSISPLRTALFLERPELHRYSTSVLYLCPFFIVSALVDYSILIIALPIDPSALPSNN